MPAPIRKARRLPRQHAGGIRRRGGGVSAREDRRGEGRPAEQREVRRRASGVLRGSRGSRSPGCKKRGLNTLGRELVRQAEALERDIGPHRIVRLLRQPREDLAIGILRGTCQEGRDLADLRAAKRQHVEREPSEGLLVRIPGVVRDRLLSARVSPSGAPAPQARQWLAPEPYLYRVTTLEPGSHRRHRERRVLGQHGDDRPDVAALPGLHVALHDLAYLLVAERSQGGLLTLLREPLFHRLPRALQGAVRRRDGRVERLRSLLRREAEHVAEDQHGALRGRQMLKRGDEGELDALALLVAGLGRRVPVLEAELPVGG